MGFFMNARWLQVKPAKKTAAQKMRDKLMKEGDEESCDYADLRRKNILERIELFEQLDFGDSKDCSRRSLTKSNKNSQPKLLPSRKSKRLKQKFTQQVMDKDLIAVNIHNTPITFATLDSTLKEI